MAFAMSLLSMGNAVASEKFKSRNSINRVNLQQIEVGDQEGHVYAIYESKGIVTIMQGKAFFDGLPTKEVGFLDINVKSGTGYGPGFGVVTDKDGDKTFATWEGKPGKGSLWEGTATYTGGTGKWQGIQGKCTWVTHDVARGQSYNESECEIELPR